MDSNLVARVNVDAYCPKIRKKQQNVHSHVGCPKPSVWEMEITVYPLHGQSIGLISTALNRGRLVTSIRRDTTASEPIPTRWASNMGGKTHLIQARPKDLCFSLHSPFIQGGQQNTHSSSEIPLFLPPFPIHTRWAAKQTRLGRNRCRQIFSIGAGL